MRVALADPIRLFIARWLISPLQGVSFGDWMRVLGENRWAIPPAFWPRALLTTLTSLLNSAQARREQRVYGARIRATRVEAPLFILGHYRSGTTHLHNLFAQDARFAFLNNYQANQPRTFLTTEAVGARLGAGLAIRRRPQDNVRVDLEVPTEDELALCADTFLSPHMGWHFPRRADHYLGRYLTFERASADERQRWVESLRTLARKLTLGRARRIVFKSPLHTARIPLLLEAFPDACFVHISRDPFVVFQSTLHMERKVEPLFRYQHSRRDGLEDRILERYRLVYDAYLAGRSQIPPGRLVEVDYDDLDREPLRTLQRIYTDLELPDFELARPAIAAYLETVRGYERNTYPPLQAELRRRIESHWGRYLAELGYSLDSPTSSPTAR